MPRTSAPRTLAARFDRVIDSLVPALSVLGREDTRVMQLRLAELDLKSAELHGDPNSTPVGILGLGNPKFTPGVDFLPLTGYEDIPSAHQANVRKARVVFGGRLGTSDVIAPFRAAGTIVVFLPPVRGDGLPDYQVWRVAAQLREYREAAAILIAMLDVMPRAAQRLFVEPTLAPEMKPSGSPLFPPIVATTRAVASMLLMLHVDGAKPGYTVNIKASLRYQRRDVGPTITSRSVVRVLQGADPNLRSEYVVLSALLDDPATGDSPRVTQSSQSARSEAVSPRNSPAALLAAAEFLSTEAPRPARSIMFVWLAGDAHGQLATRALLRRPPASTDRIVGAIEMDVDGAGRGRDTGAEGVALVDAAHTWWPPTPIGQWSAALGERVSLPTRWSNPTSPIAGRGCSEVIRAFVDYGVPAVRLESAPAKREGGALVRSVELRREGIARFVWFVAEATRDISNAPAPQMPPPTPRQSPATCGGP